MTGHNGFSGLNRRLHELQTDNRIVGFTFSRGTFESPFEKQIEKDRLNHLFRKLEIRKLEI